MALLHRFVKLNDRGNTHVFSFVVTRSVTRDLHRDVTSKELTYGYQKWAITFSRSEKVLGVYLVWRNPCEGMRVYIDFTFTLLNREHFSVNEAFTGKQVKFTYDSPAQGKRKLINMEDLYSRNFTDENGEFQLELTVSNIRTVFEAEMRAAASINGGVSPRKEKKYESPYFHFGHYDWHISVTSAGGGSDSKPTVQLRRLTGFDHQCRVRYLMVLGEGERRTDSGILDQLSDHEGRTPGWTPARARLSDLVNKGVMRLYLEMLLANTTSEIKVVPLSAQTTPVQLYDRDKAAWALEPDLHSDMFRLRLVYNDVNNVPRNHLRYMCWNAYLLRRANRGYVESVCLTNGPFSNYYAQESLDDGIIMESDVPVKELKEATTAYLDEKKEVTVQIEWIESLLLFQATYHKYDDVTRMHNYQMRLRLKDLEKYQTRELNLPRREINSLEAENYSLERQLVSYQKTMSYTQTRGTYGEDPQTEDRVYLEAYANGKRDYPDVYSVVPDKYPPDKFPTDKFPPDKYPAEKYPADKYPADKYPADKYPADKYPADKYPAEKYPADKYPADKYPADKYPADKYPADKYPADKYPADKYPTDKYPAEKYPADKREFVAESFTVPEKLEYDPDAYANGKRDYGGPRSNYEYSYDRGFSTDTEYA